MSEIKGWLDETSIERNLFCNGKKFILTFLVQTNGPVSLDSLNEIFEFEEKKPSCMMNKFFSTQWKVDHTSD